MSFVICQVSGFFRHLGDKVCKNKLRKRGVRLQERMAKKRILLISPSFTKMAEDPSALSWGVSEGLSFGIVYWLLFGLFQGISHEQVDNQDRRVFNQGIRRSLRNSVIMGIISGGVILITGILNVGLSIGTAFGPSFGLSITLSAGLYVEFGFGQLSGLHFGLNIGPLFGLSYWLLLAVCGGLLVSSASGGLAVLRHIVLRLLLWRTRTFPWRSAQFLEDAAARIFLRRIGGGYSFSHRLLMDYFLDL